MKTSKPTSTWVRSHCIGKGSFGTVNLALSQQPDAKLFAVKSVHQNSGHHQIQALENEIQILSSLSSPCIVDYLGDDVSIESDGFSYRNLHMEYLPAGTVADLPVLSGEETVKSYAWCIVSALSYIHSKGIIHCDVKGKNVLLGTTPGTAKLADFGSAMSQNDEIGPVEAEATRGSPLWMAPEVIRGEYQGPESDVWSLGCTVIEMMTGKPAWEDRGWCHTLFQIGYSDNLPEWPSGLSKIAEDFLDKCLRRDRNERWSCDMLLRHPFISSSEPFFKVNNTHILERSSPRLVLDWASIEREEGDVESAKVRIQKLATKMEVNWESDGWSEVRNLVGDGDGDGKTEVQIQYSNSSNSDQNIECRHDSGTTQQTNGRRPEVYATMGEENGAGCKSQLIMFFIKNKSEQLTFSLFHLLCVFFYIILLLLIQNLHPFGAKRLDED
ncbi:mitogen-activated protein kinase kinase kinase 17-like [Impatiens glandulifera]|uniref:mitogen-activated protein kinase kinase kinase 17-like n=1 Tax=Impatiens glandulifera TaxID=253017 RepID=UPI001FB16EC9|nr:mitogen-activated protein kinase kinase kinase 17-like [Impatiens glandulifera]